MNTVAGDENENPTIAGAAQGGEFYCPQGNKFYSPSSHFDEEFKKAFEENCQCDCCKYGSKFPNHDFGCSGPMGLGENLENNNNGKAACVIHDHCYGTIGTTREACDNDFGENLRTVCKDGLKPDDCEKTIDFYLGGLAIFGSGYFKPFNDCPTNCFCRNRIH